MHIQSEEAPLTRPQLLEAMERTGLRHSLYLLEPYMSRTIRRRALATAAAPRSWPTPPGSQVNTFEGVNVRFLRKMSAHENRVQRLRRLLVLPPAVILGLLGGNAVVTRADLGWAPMLLVYAAGALCALAAVAICGTISARDGNWWISGMKPNEETTIRAVLRDIELSELPGRSIRSRPLWQLGLGQRLSHLSTEVNETMFVLSDEVEANLEELADVAQAVLTETR